MIINPDGSGEQESIFANMPAFSNLEHKAAFLTYHDKDINVFLYDFETGSVDSLFSIPYNSTMYGLEYSLEENYLLLFGSELIPAYYSFKDHSVYDPEITFINTVYDWRDDSTLICLTTWVDNSPIVQFCFADHKLDTLINNSEQDGTYFTGLAYNKKENLLAYTYDDWITDSLLAKYYDFNTLRDSIIFDYHQDDSSELGLSYLEQLK